MISQEAVIQLGLSMPGAAISDHFNRLSFRVENKIFATLHPDTNRAVLKLTPVDQSVFCDFDSAVFYPVPGAWGKQGWTFIELKLVKKQIFKDALTTAWENRVSLRRRF